MKTGLGLIYQTYLQFYPHTTRKFQIKFVSYAVKRIELNFLGKT